MACGLTFKHTIDESNDGTMPHLMLEWIWTLQFIWNGIPKAHPGRLHRQGKNKIAWGVKGQVIALLGVSQAKASKTST